MRPTGMLLLTAALMPFAQARCEEPADLLLWLTPDPPLAAGAVSPEGCYIQPMPVPGALATGVPADAVCHSAAMASPGVADNEFVSAPLPQPVALHGFGRLHVTYRNDLFFTGCDSLCESQLHVSVDELAADGSVRPLREDSTVTSGGYGVNAGPAWPSPLPAGPLGVLQTRFFFEAVDRLFYFERRVVPAGNRIRLRLRIETPSGNLSEGRLLFGGGSVANAQGALPLTFKGLLALRLVRVDAGADFAVPEQAVAKLDARASNWSDYTWYQRSGPPAVLDDVHSATPTFTAPEVCEPTQLVFSLNLNGGIAADPPESDEVSVTVTNLNASPVAEAGPDFAVDGGHAAMLDALASRDADACQELTYAWTQTSGPSVSLADAHGATAEFTAPALPSDTPLTFDLTVTDPEGAHSTDTVTVLVRKTEAAPPSDEIPPSGEIPAAEETAPVVPPPAQPAPSDPTTSQVDSDTAGGGGPLSWSALLPLLLASWRRRRVFRGQPRVRAKSFM